MSYFDRLRINLEDYMSDEHINNVYESYIFARNAHRGQKRSSGQSYITHPVAAANILACLKMDKNTIIATLLHDVVEDTCVSVEDLKKTFDDDIAYIVDGVTKLTKIHFKSKAEANAEYFRKMILAMTKDIRVIIVKVADRLHNMRTINSLSYLKAKKISKETIEVYAPIANRLGMRNFAIELEDLSMKVIYPMRYEVISKNIRQYYSKNKKYINEINKNLSERLNANNIKLQVVSARKKNIYSIYKKMCSKKKSFYHIIDTLGFIILVRNVNECYLSLGIVHSLYSPRANNFKDYIAIPKINGYQSIHTTLHGPSRKTIEIQIRTIEMDRIATYGIASHDSYKENGYQYLQKAKEKIINEVLDVQSNSKNSFEFIENIKSEFYFDEIYVFNYSNGDIIKMPQGSTVIDFAYCISLHSGEHCISAEVDNKFVQISTKLSNGQTVKIHTADNTMPNIAWLSFAKTTRARNSIKNYFKFQKKKKAIAVGKKLLKYTLSLSGKKISDISDKQSNVVIKKFDMDDFDELFERIGDGKISPYIVVNLIFNKIKDEKYNISTPLIIEGTDGALVSLSNCCLPIPGDVIVGKFVKNLGLEVHVTNCHNITSTSPLDLIYLKWSDNAVGLFKARMVIRIYDSRGALAFIAQVISEQDANIEDIIAINKSGNIKTLAIIVSIKSKSQLNIIMKCIKNNTRVIHISRNSNQP